MRIEIHLACDTLAETRPAKIERALGLLTAALAEATENQALLADPSGVHTHGIFDGTELVGEFRLRG